MKKFGVRKASKPALPKGVEYEFTARLQTQMPVVYIGTLTHEGVNVRRKDGKLELGLVPWDRILDNSIRVATNMVQVPPRARKVAGA